MSESSTFRYGLIGCGGMGRGHLKSVGLIEGASVVAGADPHAPSLDTTRDKAAEWDLPPIDLLSDSAALLGRDDLDAVIIATPNDTHADLIVAALQAGHHVLTEKPLATTAADCRRVCEAAAKAKGILQVGFELRYAGLFQALHRLVVDEQRVGRVRQMWCKEFRGPFQTVKVDNWIINQARSGGALNEKDSHHFDLFNWIVGEEPARVSAFGTRDGVYGADHFGGTEPDILDNAQAMIQYHGGATATLMLNLYAVNYWNSLEVGVIGTEGMLEAVMPHDGRDRITLRRRLGETTEIHEIDRPSSEVEATSHRGWVHQEHLAFIETVREGRDPSPNARDGERATRIALAAEQSAAEGRTIDLS